MDEQSIINGTRKLYLRVIDTMNCPMDIIFLDEAGFNNFQAPNYGWAPKGSGAIHIKHPEKSGNITLLLAVSHCFGVICYQFMDKHLNQATFIYFLQELKRIMTYKMRYKKQPYAIFLDNLGAHKTKNVYCFYYYYLLIF